jgi:hypothetical protein
MPVMCHFGAGTGVGGNHRGTQMIEFRRGYGALVGAVLLVTTGAGGSHPAEKSLSLDITGAQGARYTGQCTLTTAAGEETFELSGVVPRHEEFTGEGLACRIESAGSIAVEIARDGSRSRSATSGGTVRIAVR